MNEKTYTVTLADGTKFENLSQNGSYYISSEELTASVFENNCTTVTVSDGTTEETLSYMELINIIKLDGGWGFALRQLSKNEINQLLVRADIDYLAMMTGVEL